MTDDELLADLQAKVDALCEEGEPRINVADIPARLLVEEGDQWKESSSARETLLLILRRATPQQRGQLAAVVRMGCRPGSGYTQENPLIWEVRIFPEETA
jgi:hypothetical protein